MLKFEPISLSHKETMAPFLQQDNVFTTERNFACLFIWSCHYCTEVCITEDLCYLRAKGKNETRYGYYPPLGTGDTEKALKEISLCEEGRPFAMFGLTPAQAQQYSQLLGSRIVCEESRSSFDYIYTANALITLAGRPYSAKRNHLNKFRSVYEGRWEYRDIDFETDEAAILEFQKQWCLEKEESGQTGFQHEQCAILRALKYHRELGILGGLLLVDDKIAAYTLAAPTNNTAIDILIEKASMEVNGAYPMINNAFAAKNCAQYTYINREEDLGIPGLRKAKLSYNPDMMLEKYTAQVSL